VGVGDLTRRFRRQLGCAVRLGGEGRNPLRQSGQFVEGNILTPRLVGSSVGLHPVWLIFALSAFGTLFGFVGLLVAVPVAAMIGVLMRFGIAQYKESRLYTGLSGKKDD